MTLVAHNNQLYCISKN